LPPLFGDPDSALTRLGGSFWAQFNGVECIADGEGLAARTADLDSATGLGEGCPGRIVGDDRADRSVGFRLVEGVVPVRQYLLDRPDRNYLELDDAAVGKRARNIQQQPAISHAGFEVGHAPTLARRRSRPRAAQGGAWPIAEEPPCAYFGGS
jgi:hypothetical protein